MTDNTLECLFHVTIRFRPARLSRAYLCVS